MIGKEEAKEILLASCNAYDRKRGFPVFELQVPDDCIYEFEEGYLMYAIPRDPDDVIFGNRAVVVEKAGGSIVNIRPYPSPSGVGGPFDYLVEAYREMMLK